MNTTDKRLDIPTPEGWVCKRGGEVDGIEAYVQETGRSKVVVDWSPDEGYEVTATDRPGTARVTPRRERAEEVVKECIERIGTDIDFTALERIHAFPDAGEVWQYRPGRDSPSFLSTDLDAGQAFLYVDDSSRDTGQVTVVVLGGDGDDLDQQYCERGNTLTLDGDMMVASDDWLPVSREAASGMRFIAHLNGVIDHPNGIEIRKRK